MNQYETVFILTHVLSDEQIKETIAKFKKLLTDNGAEILNEEAWGLKKMAYAIQKKSTGFYCLLEFKAEPSLINKLEVNYRRDEKVIRFMTVKLDKYAAEYAIKRKNKYAKNSEEASIMPRPELSTALDVVPSAAKLIKSRAEPKKMSPKPIIFLLIFI